jgi:hypothetical protein
MPISDSGSFASGGGALASFGSGATIKPPGFTLGPGPASCIAGFFAGFLATSGADIAAGLPRTARAHGSVRPRDAAGYSRP